jgi:hypothetical protein
MANKPKIGDKVKIRFNECDSGRFWWGGEEATVTGLFKDGASGTVVTFDKQMPFAPYEILHYAVPLEKVEWCQPQKYITFTFPLTYDNYSRVRTKVEDGWTESTNFFDKTVTVTEPKR